MEKNVFLSDRGIEIYIDFDADYDFYYEDFHGSQLVEKGTITLNVVELKIGSQSIDILPHLTEKQIDFLVNNCLHEI